MVGAISSQGGGLGEIATMSWRKPSPGGGPPIAPVRGQSTAQVRVRSTPGRLLIDSTQAREEMGYRTMMSQLRAGWEYSDQAARKGIARIVANGNRMAAVHTGENAIAAIAFERMLIDYKEHKYGLAFIPRTPPQISYTPGTTSIDFVS